MGLLSSRQLEPGYYVDIYLHQAKDQISDNVQATRKFEIWGKKVLTGGIEGKDEVSLSLEENIGTIMLPTDDFNKFLGPSSKSYFGDSRQNYNDNHITTNNGADLSKDSISKNDTSENDDSKDDASKNNDIFSDSSDSDDYSDSSSDYSDSNGGNNQESRTLPQDGNY